MGTKFHLRSRDIVAETDVTRTDKGQSVSRVFTGQREKGREENVPGWCVEESPVEGMVDGYEGSSAVRLLYTLM